MSSAICFKLRWMFLDLFDQVICWFFRFMSIFLFLKITKECVCSTITGELYVGEQRGKYKRMGNLYTNVKGGREE